MNAPIPFKSYGVLVLDWPWHFDTYSDAGREKSAEYDTLPASYAPILREELQLDFVFSPHVVAVFWATWSMLARGDVHQVISGLGFKAVSGGAWLKMTRHGRDTIGTGYCFRDSCEPFIVATRGDPEEPRVKNIRNGFRAVRPPAHSQKPWYIHKALERMFPNTNKLEIFAREPRAGWDGWGKDYGRAPEPTKRRTKADRATERAANAPALGPLLTAMGEE